MNPDPHGTRVNGGRTSIALETEPLVFFHPMRAGLVPPGAVQPVRGMPLLEEEPVTWPELAPEPDASGVERGVPPRA